METMITEVTSMSTKGQIVIPKNIRESLSLVPGSKLMIFSDGENIFLKPIIKPDKSEFLSLMDQAQEWAANVGMKDSDIEEAIAAVRSTRKLEK